MASPNTRRVEKKEGDDLYNTPLEAMVGLDRCHPWVFDKFNTYYDPCNGLSKISNYLKDKGKKVHTSDIREYRGQDEVLDFLKTTSIPDKVDCIIFNCPFLLTREFVNHAYKLIEGHPTCNNILMFNRLTTLESKERASNFYNGEWNLTHAFVFGYRISCTKGVEEDPTANSVCYSWFLLEDKTFKDSCKLEWII